MLQDNVGGASIVIERDQEQASGSKETPVALTAVALNPTVARFFDEGPWWSLHDTHAIARSQGCARLTMSVTPDRLSVTAGHERDTYCSLRFCAVAWISRFVVVGVTITPRGRFSLSP